MIARFMMIAATALTAASAVAEPAKVSGAGTQKATRRPSTVVLASADRIVGNAAPAQSAPAPAKRPRAMRVTTCRCGDPQPQAEEQEQQ